MKEISEIIRVFEQAEEQMFALATLVRARGSSYRRAGARMLVRLDGYAVGSLSGGCLEEEVSLLARAVIETGEPKLISFDMRQRFGCNGEIEVFIECADNDFLRDLGECFRVRQSCVAVTNFQNAADKLGSRIVGIGEALPAESFHQRIDPPIQLVVIGAGHDTLPFRSLCELLGWQFIEAPSIDNAPESFDAWTAAIVKTHHYGRDFAALQKLVPLGLRYLGLIGPRRRRDQLLADLVDITGPIDAELFAPAGLDLGAETPEEIALAVVAEIQSVFAAASAESLRNRKTPIHPINYDLPISIRAIR